MKKLYIVIIAMVLLAILGTLFMVGMMSTVYLEYPPTPQSEPVGAPDPVIIRDIPESIDIGGVFYPVSYTDDNQGEDLIIKLSEENISSVLGTARVLFSVTNATQQAQPVDIVVSTQTGVQIEPISIRRFDGNVEETIAGMTIPATATSSELVIPDSTFQKPLWTEISLDSFSSKGQPRKDVLPTVTKKQGTTDLQAGETRFYELTLATANLPENGAEIILEAFGNQNSYGHVR